MTPTERELDRAKRESRKLRRALKDITDVVLVAVHEIDGLAATPQPKAAKRLVGIVNGLELANDIVRHRALGVDIRNENKEEIVGSLKSANSDPPVSRPRRRTCVR